MLKSNSLDSLWKVNHCLEQLEEPITKCKQAIQAVSFKPIQSAQFNVTVEKIKNTFDNIIRQLKECAKKFENQLQPYFLSETSIITPRRCPESIFMKNLNLTLKFPAEVKSQQDFDLLASSNDGLYKEFEMMLQNFHHTKLTLNHQNQILLNQWLQKTNLISSFDMKNNLNKRDNFLCLVESLIQKLSKYESVEEQINILELIEHEKFIRELKSASCQYQDSEIKWLKQTTKNYLLEMAQILKNQDIKTLEADEMQNFSQLPIKDLF